MLSRGHIIDSPGQLQRLAEQDQTIEHRAHISLLAPQAHDETLKQCRAEGKRGGVTTHQYLKNRGLREGVATELESSTKAIRRLACCDVILRRMKLSREKGLSERS